MGRQANPNVWSHEFRHENVNDARYFDGEVANRLFDVLYGSTSLPAYKSNVEQAYRFILRNSDDYTKLPFEEREALNAVSLKDQEDFVLTRLKGLLSEENLQRENVSTSSRMLNALKNTFSKNLLERTRELNQSVRRTEELPKEAIELRSKLPFLNFVGKLEEYENPVKRASGSPSKGETAPSREQLRELMLAMNPDAEQIEEAAAAAPRVPAVARSLGKGFYEANVEPLLSPYDTAMAIFGAGKEFVQNPRDFSESVARAELERLRAAEQKPEAAAEYTGSMISPFSMLRRVPRSDVVRPKGQGIVLDYPDAPLVPIGDKDPGLDEAYGTTRFPKGFVNRTIEDGQERLKTLNARGGVNLDQSVAIDEFLRTKFRNYFVNQFGTKDDPILKAIKEGRLSTVQLREAGGIRGYMPTAAKEGKTRVNPETNESTFYPTSTAKEALEDINKIYDQMTGMRGTVIANRTVGSPKNEYSVLDTEREKSQQLLNETSEALVAEGNRPLEINPSMGILGYKDPTFAAKLPPGKRLSDVTPLQGRRRSSTASADIAALMLAQQENLPKSLRMAIEKGQPIYDMSPSGALDEILAPEPLVDYLATLSPREIKNLRYEDAVRGATKLNELSNQRKAVVERIREGKPVDNKIFMEGVSAPIINYDDKAQFPGFTWRQITDPEATTIEGAYIGHSVGGYAKEGTYSADSKKDFRSGAAKIYTLRDAEGKPVTTVEVKEIEGRGPIVTQVKGAGRKTGNQADKAPYDALLVDLFNTLNVAGVTERNLPPLAKAYQEQRDAATRVQVRGRLGAPQPIGEPPVPQMVPQQGIGQLPGAPQNLPNEGFIQQMLRRLQRDQD